MLAFPTPSSPEMEVRNTRRKMEVDPGRLRFCDEVDRHEKPEVDSSAPTVRRTALLRSTSISQTKGFTRVILSPFDLTIAGSSVGRLQ